MISNWDPLKVFFKEEVDKLKKGKSSSYAMSKAEAIFHFIRSPTNKLYVLFLLHAVKIMEPFLTSLQAEQPMIHQLRRKLLDLLRKVLSKFVQPTGMMTTTDGKTKEVPVEEVDFKTLSNLKEKSELSIGEQATLFISKAEENHLRPAKVLEFYRAVQKYYIELTAYLFKNLPVPQSVCVTTKASKTSAASDKNEKPQAKSAAFLKLLEVADTELQTEVSFESLRSVLQRFPVLIPANSSLGEISEQFSLYQVTDISSCKADRLDLTWAKIGLNPDFTQLSLVMRGILTVPHSSAPCERIFSCVRKNKTSQRDSLSTKMLESLLVLKNKGNDPLASVKDLDKSDLQQFKSAYYKSLK